jgi:hypothetical protein
VASSLREMEEFARLSPSDPLYIHQDPMPVGSDIMTQQEAISELSNREMAARAAGTVSPFESSWNPVDPNFRQTVKSSLNNLFGGSQISSSPNYLQGRVANTLTSLLDFTPVVGDAVGIGDTMTSYRQGDMLGTGINAAATGIGVLPLVGGPASKAVKAGGNRVRSALRDIGGDMPITSKETKFLKRPNDFSGVNSMQVKYSEPELSQVPIARAEDLIDRAYMTGITDTSRSGLETVETINGIPIYAKMRGGAYWGYQPEQIEKKQAFASAEGAISGQLNRANLAQKSSSREGVIFAPHGMVGSSPDFATMSVDVAVPYARQVISRSDKRFIDKQIREGKKKKDGTFTEGIEGWVGIDKASEEYLSGLGGKRKLVLNALDDYRSTGALDLSQVRSIVTDPDQFDQPWGSVNAFYELDPSTYMGKSRVQGVSSHPSYAAALGGRTLGAAAKPFNITELSPNMGTARTGEINFLDEMSRRRALAQDRLAREEALGVKEEIGKARSALRGYDFQDGNAGSSIQGALKAGGQGVITREMVDDLIRRGIILP